MSSRELEFLFAPVLMATGWFSAPALVAACRALADAGVRRSADALPAVFESILNHHGIEGSGAGSLARHLASIPRS